MGFINVEINLNKIRTKNYEKYNNWRFPLLFVDPYIDERDKIGLIELIDAMGEEQTVLFLISCDYHFELKVKEADK